MLAKTKLKKFQIQKSSISLLLLSKDSIREMMLRSSSTPVLGSLLSSFSESPNHHLSSEPHHTLKHPTPPPHRHHIRPLLPLSCSSSPLSNYSLEPSSNSFRRSNSEGNLVSSSNFDDHISNISLPRPPKCSHRRLSGSVLETIPSFAFNNTPDSENENSEDEEDGNFGPFTSSSLGLKTSHHRMSVLDGFKSSGFVEEEASSGEMYLARELGVENLNIGFGGGNGGGDFIPLAYGKDDGDGNKQSAEEHYKNLVEENPGNPLFLRNYAQFLFETKKDLANSEELYSRAILADPGDGEVLSQYAKLIWELHHDKGRALNYFERAVQASPADSHVHAAHASFLWEIEDEEDEEEDKDNLLYNSSLFNFHIHKGVMASAST